MGSKCDCCKGEGRQLGDVQVEPGSIEAWCADCLGCLIDCLRDAVISRASAMTWADAVDFARAQVAA